MSAAATAKKKKRPVSITKALKAADRKLRRMDTVDLPDMPVGYPEIMTVEQVAEYTQRHRLTIYREISDGTIPTHCVIRFGPKTLRIFKSELDKHLRAKAAEGAR